MAKGLNQHHKASIIVCEECHRVSLSTVGNCAFCYTRSSKPGFSFQDNFGETGMETMANNRRTESRRLEEGLSLMNEFNN